MRLAMLVMSCLSFALTSLIAKNGEFSQNRDLPPLRLAASDLDTILHKTQAIVAAANGPAASKTLPGRV